MNEQTVKKAQRMKISVGLFNALFNRLPVSPKYRNYSPCRKCGNRAKDGYCFKCQKQDGLVK